MGKQVEIQNKHEAVGPVYQLKPVDVQKLMKLHFKLHKEYGTELGESYLGVCKK